jgi:fatty-acyl-CoA synthase
LERGVLHVGQSRGWAALISSVAGRRILTSGTTGFPKGATLTHHNLLNNAFFVGEGCRYTEADRVCIPVPYYHCFGMGMGNLGCTSHGATMVIPAPGFDPALALKAVQDEHCTSLYGVPTMSIAELGLSNFTSSSAATRSPITSGALGHRQ